MKLDSLRTLLTALEDAGVRYLIAGGLAVNAHGYQRLTVDVDLVILLERENVLRAFRALDSIGYIPLVPVTAEDFADAATRQDWIENKHMKVLNFYSDEHRETPLDVFVRYDFDFEAEYRNALQGEILSGINGRFVSITTLIEMKKRAGRNKDLDDIQHLRWILEEQQDHD